MPVIALSIRLKYDGMISTMVFLVTPSNGTGPFSYLPKFADFFLSILYPNIFPAKDFIILPKPSSSKSASSSLFIFAIIAGNTDATVSSNNLIDCCAIFGINDFIEPFITPTKGFAINCCIISSSSVKSDTLSKSIDISSISIIFCFIFFKYASTSRTPLAINMSSLLSLALISSFISSGVLSSPFWYFISSSIFSICVPKNSIPTDINLDSFSVFIFKTELKLSFIDANDPNNLLLYSSSLIND